MALLAAALSVALLLVGVVPPTAAAAGGSVGLHGSLAQTDAAELDRFWSRSVGSGRLINGVRADWQRHLRLAREKLGFTYIRAHGTLNSEFQISPAPGVYSFINLDVVCDFLVEIGMKPILELDFMPDWLASNNVTARGPHAVNSTYVYTMDALGISWPAHPADHVEGYKCTLPVDGVEQPAWPPIGGTGGCTPPKSLELWEQMIGDMARHLVQRYGEEEVSSWFFEVWNEPNDNFWKGDQQDYFALYNASAVALKNVSSKLRVGGPATNGPAVWVPEFIDFCENNSVPVRLCLHAPPCANALTALDVLGIRNLSHIHGLPRSLLGADQYDFVSSHLYAGGRDGKIANIEVVLEGIAQAQATIQGEHPWLITEWSANAAANDWKWNTQAQYHELPASAAFIIACVDAILVNTTDAAHLRPLVLSYWVFSDVFQEGGLPTVNASFHGGFGLLNIFGVPKPAFRAFELLANLTGRRVPVHAVVRGGKSGALCTQNVHVLSMWDEEDHTLQLLIANHGSQLGNSTPAAPCNVTVRIDTARPGHATCTAVTSADLRRIDGEHANPRVRWIEMGMPQYPSRSQNAEILAASHMESLRFGDGEGVGVEAGGVAVNVSVPPYAVAAVNVSLRC